MANNIASKERKPAAVVSVGSVSIPIYAAPVTVKKALPATDAKLMQNLAVAGEAKTYQSYQIAHYEGDRRILQRRRTLEAARALAREIAYRLIITDNINQVAEECGTSPNMIKKNYQSRAAISKATAEEWFAI